MTGHNRVAMHHVQAVSRRFPFRASRKSIFGLFTSLPCKYHGTKNAWLDTCQKVPCLERVLTWLVGRLAFTPQNPSKKQAPRIHDTSDHPRHHFTSPWPIPHHTPRPSLRAFLLRAIHPNNESFTTQTRLRQFLSIRILRAIEN